MIPSKCFYPCFVCSETPDIEFCLDLISFLNPVCYLLFRLTSWLMDIPDYPRPFGQPRELLCCHGQHSSQQQSTCQNKSTLWQLLGGIFFPYMDCRLWVVGYMQILHLTVIFVISVIIYTHHALVWDNEGCIVMKDDDLVLYIALIYYQVLIFQNVSIVIWYSIIIWLRLYRIYF